jgi:hypothetical protein
MLLLSFSKFKGKNGHLRVYSEERLDKQAFSEVDDDILREPSFFFLHQFEF